MKESDYYEAVMLGSIKSTFSVDKVLKSHGLKGLIYIIGNSFDFLR